jgi:hypothetical protein
MKYPISEQQRRCATASDPIRNLAKQYEELCRLREQVQIAESRQRVLSRGSCTTPGDLLPIGPQNEAVK